MLGDEMAVNRLVTVEPNAYFAAESSHALVICTEWDEFKVINCTWLKCLLSPIFEKNNQNYRWIKMRLTVMALQEKRYLGPDKISKNVKIFITKLLNLCFTNVKRKRLFSPYNHTCTGSYCCFLIIKYHLILLQIKFFQLPFLTIFIYYCPAFRPSKWAFKGLGITIRLRDNRGL